MVLLRGLNYDYSGEQHSKITESVAVGAVTLTLQNTEGFADDDYIVIAPNTEKSEIVKIDALVINNAKVTTTAFKFNHVIGDVVYRLPYNQMRFYEHPTADMTSAAVVATVDMNFADVYTKYPYPDTYPDYYYKRTFYNSTTFVESNIDLSIAWQTDDEELYVTAEEMRMFLQFDNNDFPAPSDLRFFIKIAMANVGLDLESSNSTLLFIATLYNTKALVMRALASRSISKGYVQINAEGRTISKAYQEFVLEAENTLQEYKEFLLRNGRREATSTNFLNNTALIDDYTRLDIINMMNGVTDGQDFQQKYGFRRL